MSIDTQTIEGLENLSDRRVAELVVEICDTIRQKFPEAHCRTFPNPTYRGAIVEAYIDSDEMDPMLDLTSDRLVDILVDEDISIRVWPSNRAWLRAS